MPILKPYTATLDKPDRAIPVMDPEAFGAGVGTTLAKESKEILKAKEDGEQQTALVSNAQIRAKYAKALDDAQQSGAPVGPLKEQMNQDLAKVGENFVTQGGTAALDYHTARTNELFDTQANRIAVTRAAEDARLKGMQFVQSQSAVLASNPLYLDSALQDTDALVATLNVPPEKRALAAAEIKNQLNAAAAMASARIDPEKAKLDLENGKWDLTPDQRRLGISQAEAQIRAKRVDAEYQRALKMQDIHDRNEAAANDLVIGIIRGKVNDKMIGDNPDLVNETRRALISFLAARTRELQGEQKVSDPVVLRNLWLRINAPDDDPNKIFVPDPILKSVSDGHVNTTDGQKLLTMMMMNKDENNRSIATRLSGQMHIIGAALSQDPKFVGQPALVAGIQMDYQARVMDRSSEMRAAGVSPNEMFNPKSKDYIGSPEFLQQSITDVTARQRAALPKPVQVTDERDPKLLDVKDGQTFIDPKGVERKMTPAFRQSLGQIGGGPVTQPSPYESMVERAGRRGYEINAGARSPAKVLNGKTYRTKQEAIDAITKFYAENQ